MQSIIHIFSKWPDRVMLTNTGIPQRYYGFGSHNISNKMGCNLFAGKGFAFNSWKRKKKKTPRLWSTIKQSTIKLGMPDSYLSVFIGRLSVNVLSLLRGRLANYNTSSPGDEDWVGAVHVTWIEPESWYSSGKESWHNHQGPLLLPHRRRSAKENRAAKRGEQRVGGAGGGGTWEVEVREGCNNVLNLGSRQLIN